MNRSIVIVMILIVTVYATTQAQEIIITGFPPGVGSDIDPGFFEPYQDQLRALADTLRNHPWNFAVVTGGADGLRFNENHDAKNPGLAVGRAQALRNLLVLEFGIDPNRIILQSDYSQDEGGPFRYAKVRVAGELSDLEARIDSLERRPPVETPITEVREIYGSISEKMGLQLGAGFSSSPFGGIPVATGAITWRRFVFVEGIVGHTFWDNSFSIENDNLATRRRMAGGLAIIYPFPDIPVGITGGWIRVEEIAQRYNEYVRMSEGPVIGLRIKPLDYMSITAVQNTAKHNIIGDLTSRLKNGQFLLFVNIHILFGGGK